MKPTVVMYATAWCPFCVRARMLLKARGVPFTEIDVGAEPARREAMTRRCGRTSVPQIWIGDRHIGGCAELKALDRRGELARLLDDIDTADHEAENTGEPHE